MRRLDVSLHFGGGVGVRPLGVLVADGPELYFSYDAGFVANPLPVSPFVLPVDSQLYRHDDVAFDRLPGLFFDALPDGWGRLLQDRAFARLGLSRSEITPLDRLAAVGDNGVGALTFAPSTDLSDDDDEWAWQPSLVALADHAGRIYDGSEEEVLPQLLAGGGSPGGARPKILAGVRLTAGGKAEVYAGGASTLSGRATDLPVGYAPWIIKFPSREEGKDAGAVEAAYANMARAAGITVPDTRLFIADSRRYFGIARFDRCGPDFTHRVHIHTLGGLVHADYRQPSLDYESYLQVTYQLVGGSMPAVEEAFRRMVFNILAHNRDDHARNFAFLMTPDGAWQHSPAYDLTFSAGPNGEHTMAVAGEGRAPTLQHIHAVADSADLSRRRADAIIEEVGESVGIWEKHARSVDLSTAITSTIADRLTAIRTTVFGTSNVRRPRQLRRRK
jgi:serine/threonine-protein kinase HipA